MAVTESLTDVKVPYSEVAAYNEYLGRNTYVDGSYGDQFTIFTLLWTSNGFTGHGWTATDLNGPLDKLNDNELENMDNEDIKRAISSWAESTNAISKLDWMTYFAERGCVN